ncbi:MAG: amidase, partial [Desulfobacteraceae bacterium]|nr:amidase [Desulfobacteraceae bacterium]
MRLNEMTAGEAAKGIAEGSISSVALVAACIERIGDREDTVGAWEYLDPEHALRQARELDRSPWRGLLHGIPVGIKDIMDTADMPTAYGSPIYRAGTPAWDAACVSLIRAAGGIVLGKTVTAELACTWPGKTRNPHNPAHTPGGSSSGSAAAVADFMVPLATGTQTAGSVIRPGSFCGVVACKPSFGWISRAGVKLVSDSLDTIGFFSRSVEDAALLAAVLTGRTSLLLQEPETQKPKIGLCRTFEWPYAEEGTRTAFEAARNKLEEAGIAVGEVALPAPFSGLAAAQREIMAFEAARSLSFEYQQHREMLSPFVTGLIEAGEAVTTHAYDTALALTARCRALLPEVFSGYDALLAPSAAGEAPEGLESTGDPIFDRIWTLLHVPCVNIPITSGPKGLPVGLQLVGRIGEDRRVLFAADWLMRNLHSRPT